MVEKRILGFCIDSLITSSCDAAIKSADSRGRRQESWAGLGKFVFAFVVCLLGGGVTAGTCGLAGGCL